MPFLKALLFGFRFLPQPMSAGTHRYNPLPTCRYFVAVDKNEAPSLPSRSAFLGGREAQERAARQAGHVPGVRGPSKPATVLLSRFKA